MGVIPEQIHPLAPTGAVQVKTTVYRIGLICTPLFCGMALIAWFSPTGGPVWAGVMLGIALLYTYFFAATAVLKVDHVAVEATSAFGTHRILWDEVRSVSLDANGMSLIFHGEGKRLVINGPGYWCKDGRQEMRDYLLAEMSARRIPYDSAAPATNARNKNVRVVDTRS